MDDFIEYVQNKLNEIDYKKLIFPTIVILLYIGGFFYFQTIIRNIKTEEKTISNKVSITEEKNDEIVVDVKGEVSSPGVYKLKSGDRVIDAIKASGGLTENANTRFINLSKSINDGDVIVVYSTAEIENAKKDNIVYIETPCVCEEVKNDSCYKETKENTSNGKININTSTQEELQTLNGIGESKARAIIEYRNKFGNFKSIEEIKNVNGISETIYAKIKENITV